MAINEWDKCYGSRRRKKSPSRRPRKSKSRTRKLRSRRRKSSRMEHIADAWAEANPRVVDLLRQGRQQRGDIRECLNVLARSENWARENGHVAVIISSILLQYLVQENDLAPDIIWDGVRRTVQSTIGRDYLNRIAQTLAEDEITNEFRDTVANTINDLANSPSLGG